MLRVEVETLIMEIIKDKSKLNNVRESMKKNDNKNVYNKIICIQFRTYYRECNFNFPASVLTEPLRCNYYILYTDIYTIL